MCFFIINVNSQDRASPVFVASQNGHRAVLLTLLAEGGNPNACRIDGASPLWIASQMGHDHISRVLLKSGAHVDAVRCVSVFGVASNSQITCIKFFLSYIGRCNSTIQGSTQRTVGCGSRTFEIQTKFVLIAGNYL